MYSEARTHHSCKSRSGWDVTLSSFDWISAMLSTQKHNGFSLADVFYLFSICPKCDRLVLKDNFVLHICP